MATHTHALISFQADSRLSLWPNCSPSLHIAPLYYALLHPKSQS